MHGQQNIKRPKMFVTSLPPPANHFYGRLHLIQSYENWSQQFRRNVRANLILRDVMTQKRSLIILFLWIYRYLRRLGLR